ncbi:MAG: hypothetical protein N2Z72_06835 [Bacteroidales bacterium]|nr:hypothetical protein [Bacteroidales bacterium]
MKKYLFLFILVVFCKPHPFFAIDSLRVLYRNFYQLQVKQKELQEQIKNLNKLTDSMMTNDEKQFNIIQQELNAQKKQTEEFNALINQNKANDKTLQLMWILTLLALLLFIVLMVIIFLSFRKRNKELKNDLKAAIEEFQKKFTSLSSSVNEDLQKIQQNLTAELTTAKNFFEEFKAKIVTDIHQLTEKHVQDIEKLQSELLRLQNEGKEQWNALKNEIELWQAGFKKELQQYEASLTNLQEESRNGLNKIESFVHQTKNYLEDELKKLLNQFEKFNTEEKKS